MSKDLEKLEKSNKSTWGGKRPNSGRKPLMGKEELLEVKALIAQHGSEIAVVDSKSNKPIKYVRVLYLLEKLYALGVKGNIPAAKEYLDRVMGKAKDLVDITSAGEKINSLDESQLTRIARRLSDGQTEGKK